jgi:acetolactate synthase-1/2/3 large subunit
MGFPLSRRDLLKTAAAGCLASLPGRAEAGVEEKREAGLVAGSMTGAEALVETLLLEGTHCVFGIPGAQDNELWDTMKSKGLGYLLVTHEFSAAAMADGYARSTGTPGVLCVVPGPGVTNSLTGLGECLLDSVPVVCIVCDVARGEKYRPFQVHDLPHVDLLRPLTKGVFEARQPDDIPLMVRQAFQLARSGEPGPVAVLVPYPLFIATHKFHCAPLLTPTPGVDEAAFQAALARLADRKCRVGIYAGLGCMDYSRTLVEVAELLQAPVATSVSGKGVIPENHPLAVGWGYGAQGTPTAEEVFKGVDVVLAVGVRYSEVSTANYAVPKHRVIQVDVNPDNLGRVVKAEVCVPGDAGCFLTHLLEYADCLRRPPDRKLVERIENLKQSECKKNRELHGRCGVDPMALVLALRRYTGPDALVFVDVTATEHWAAEAFTTYQPRTYFNPVDNQAMGWSIPAALGAQRAFPGRQTVTLTGDGCFLMSAMELSTAAREGLPVKFFVIDDRQFHLMSVLQKPAYRRTTATVLPRLDYAALAAGLGVCYNEIVSNEGLDAGVRCSLGKPGPVLTRVITDYGDRPLRWVKAARRQFTNSLTTQQKMFFAARMGSRALRLRTEDD